MAKLILRRDDSSLWPRNSFYFKRLTLFISDLDLTLFIDKESESLKNQSIQSKIKWLKRLAPLVGEFNIIRKEFLVSLGENLPYFEVQRDPLLISKQGLKLGEPKSEDEIFYLWKMLCSDKKNLTNKFKARHKKWEFHLMQLGLSTEVYSTAQTLDEFLVNLEEALFKRGSWPDIAGFFRSFLLDRTTSFQEVSQKFPFASFVFLLPQWIGENNKKQIWRRADFSWPILSKEQRGFLEKSVEWEVWGCLTQFDLQVDELTFLTHLEVLIALCDHYEMNQFTDVLIRMRDKKLSKISSVL